MTTPAERIPRLVAFADLALGSVFGLGEVALLATLTDAASPSLFRALLALFLAQAALFLALFAHLMAASRAATAAAERGRVAAATRADGWDVIPREQRTLPDGSVVRLWRATRRDPADGTGRIGP